MRIVTAAVIVKHGRVLLVRRAPGQSGAGSWEFPGGKLEPNEDERACLARELYEELSISGTAGALVAENVYTYATGAILLRAYWFDWQSGDLIPIQTFNASKRRRLLLSRVAINPRRSAATPSDLWLSERTKSTRLMNALKVWIGITLTVHDDMRWVLPHELTHMPLSPADIPIARRVADLLSQKND